MSQREPRSGLPPTDLASTFGRSSGLSKQLGPGRARRRDDVDHPAASEVGPSPEPESQQDVAEDPAAGRLRPHASDQSPTAEDPTSRSEETPAARGRDRRGAVVIYTSTTLRSRISAYLDQTHARNADLLFDAFEATADDLPRLWADSLRGSSPQGRSLFDRGDAPQRASSEPQVGWYVAMSPANQAVLDSLVREVTGGSARKRTALAVLALSAFLDSWEQGHAQ